MFRQSYLMKRSSPSSRKVSEVKVENPLTREYLLNYPIDAARVLEQVPAEHVAALFSELSAKSGADMMAAMLPDKVTAVLQIMSAASAAKLLTELPLSFVVRVFRLLSAEKRDEVSLQLSDKTRNHIDRYLKYPAESVGALLDPAIDMLPENISVAAAIRRIERLKHSICCEIYIIDAEHHLVGTIDLGKLLKANRHLRLRDIMNRKTQRVSVYAAAESLLDHAGWLTRRRLPVVDRDNTLLGVLEHSRLQDVFAETENSATPADPLDSALSIAGLYWLTVAQLMSSIFSISRPAKENSHES